MHELLSDLWSAVEAHELARPRTKQVAVGPSELGSPCDRHLALRLQGWTRPEAAWLPFVGTAVHAALDEVLTQGASVAAAYMADDVADVYIPGWRVTVGTVNGRPVEGTFDAWHEPTRTVVDFKVVGAGVLAEAKANGPSAQYVGQVHLYARGIDRTIFRAESEPLSVAIVYLPRNAPTFEAGYVWEDVYRPDVAAQILERANRLAVEPAADWLSGHVDCWHCKAERIELSAQKVGTADEAMAQMGAQ